MHCKEVEDGSVLEWILHKPARGGRGREMENHL